MEECEMVCGERGGVGGAGLWKAVLLGKAEVMDL